MKQTEKDRRLYFDMEETQILLMSITLNDRLDRCRRFSSKKKLQLSLDIRKGTEAMLELIPKRYRHKIPVALLRKQSPLREKK